MYNRLTVYNYSEIPHIHTAIDLDSLTITQLKTADYHRTFKYVTVEPHFTDTRLIPTPRQYYEQF